MLIIAVLCTMALYFLRNNSSVHYIKLFILFGLVGSELTLNIWYLLNGAWDIAYTLPLQLCSISLYLSIFMLITKKYALFEITFFLGIGGAIQALLTPELFYDFPHFRYFHFFIAHISIVLASVYMIFVLKYKPTFKSVWKSILGLNLIAFFVFFVNKATGGNYMFLSRKPSNPSLIDYLGDYPWYIFSLELIALITFFILYLPFQVHYYMKKKD
ncbi:TIGR02206 family membrane protein [Virgibacillus necropolis]|uniref:TIGR02206 family membrane protein n=2 Tax=Virgibacillus necropolis TaxID=163877 RepID=A0A221MIF8_9BACI|nr:TIGR02206 family membrane protein [Virgibacillus necropolis]